MRNNSKRNLISKRPTAFVRVQSVIFSLIKSEKIIRSLSCKNPFCAIVKGLRFSKASEEQIPTAICEETTKRVNCHENGNLPLFYIEKDTRNGVLYAPFACVLMAARGKPQLNIYFFEILIYTLYILTSRFLSNSKPKNAHSMGEKQACFSLKLF